MEDHGSSIEWLKLKNIAHGHVKLAHGPLVQGMVQHRRVLTRNCFWLKHTAMCLIKHGRVLLVSCFESVLKLDDFYIPYLVFRVSVMYFSLIIIFLSFLSV